MTMPIQACAVEVRFLQRSRIKNNKRTSLQRNGSNSGNSGMIITVECLRLACSKSVKYIRLWGQIIVLATYNQ